MKQLEILNKIEEILQKNLNFSSSSSKKNNQSEMETQQSDEKEKVSPFKEILNLLISFFISVIKAPFQLIHLYIKKEIVTVIRTELKLYAVLIILLGIMFTVFMAFWVLISMAVGFYFQDLGYSNFQSILFTIAFQVLVFLIFMFIFFRVSRKVKSLKLFKKPLNDSYL